jgi:hypothetical protein
MVTNLEVAEMVLVEKSGFMNSFKVNYEICSY